MNKTLITLINIKILNKLNLKFDNNRKNALISKYIFFFRVNTRNFA